ncbi:MAG: hypothetical protein MJE66_18850 [Proteobacteria bacterium]|nr:hypothetical protein [Pseudomonadota bacterium]
MTWHELRPALFASLLIVGFALAPNPAGAAECDCRDADCASLTDSAGAINNLVNAELRRLEGDGVGRGVQPSKIREAFGGAGGNPIAKIENIAAAGGWGAAKPKSQSKYRNVDAFDAPAWAFPESAVMAQCVLVCDVCMGADKLGHFFDQGFQFFYERVYALSKGFSPPLAIAHAQIWNVKTEFKLAGTPISGYFGQNTTGVMSYADLFTNAQGGAFYWELMNAPPGQPYAFDICSFVRPEWSEEIQKNDYTPAVKSKVNGVGRE